VRGILQALPEVFGRASKVTVAGVELDISPTLARKLTKTEQDAIPKLRRAAIILLLNSKPGIIGKVDYYAGSEHGEGIEAYSVLASKDSWPKRIWTLPNARTTSRSRRETRPAALRLKLRTPVADFVNFFPMSSQKNSI
jgi:hypothetical protein